MVSYLVEDLSGKLTDCVCDEVDTYPDFVPLDPPTPPVSVVEQIYSVRLRMTVSVSTKTFSSNWFLMVKDEFQLVTF